MPNETPPDSSKTSGQKVERMSGGSYDYLCYCFGLEKAIDEIGNFQRMGADLRALGYHNAADTVDKLAGKLEAWVTAYETEHAEIKDLLKAFEWWQSMDTGQATFEKELAKYEQQTHT